ncbi:MAG: TlpA family protein disulfide reductase [Candidatus Hydrogenedentes bacterium]|nr:TlpA family protein disulfide reductase [Candidatus Hydrogenedentota bacterium]
MGQSFFRIALAVVVLAIALPLVLSMTAGKGSSQPRPVAAELTWPAPELQVAQWIKGGPVDIVEGEGKKIYVIEFWATYCPPCRESIPHLSKLQQQYRDKDVIIIGISPEQPNVVRPFVEKMGSQMEYVVAVDKKKRTSLAYLDGLGAEGIPYACIVDKKGIIVWAGHPMLGLDMMLERYTREPQ